MKMFQLIPNDTNFDFMGKSRIATAIAFIVVLISLLLIAIIGPKYGIDFRGGTEMVLAFQGDVSDDEVREAAGNIGLADATVQRYGVAADNRFLIQTQDVSLVDADKITEIEAQLQTIGDFTRGTWSAEQPDRYDIRFNEPVDPTLIRDTIQETGLEGVTVETAGQSDESRYTVRFQNMQDLIQTGFAEYFGERFSTETGLERLESVGPRAGEQLRNSGMLSIAIALLATLIYLWFRFDIRYSPGAVIALTHDVLIALAVFVVFQIEITLPIIAAFLTIVGYSLNDTIVIFDRIRENLEGAGLQSIEDIVNRSINETLSRTILTSSTTFLVVLCIAVMGVGMIRDFAIALNIGIVVGTFSSIFIASPMMLKMHYFLLDRKKASELLKQAESNPPVA